MIYDEENEGAQFVFYIELPDDIYLAPLRQ